MTNIYARISDGDAPKSQHVTEVSFVDEKGAHINIGAGAGGGIAQVAHDNSLAGDGTSTSPLKLGDSISAQLGDTETVLSNLRKLTKLQSDAELADVITTVNAILDAIKPTV